MGREDTVRRDAPTAPRHAAAPAPETRGASLQGAYLRLGLAAIFAIACPVLNVLFSHYGPSFFPAWRVFSNAASRALAALASVSPYALWDILAAAFALVLVIALLVACLRRRSVLPALSWAVFAVGVSAFLFTFWALNHYAPPLASELGLEVREYSVDELADACAAYLDEAAALAPEMERDADGALTDQDFFELARIAGAAYEPLGRRWDVLKGSSAPVKALLVWGPPLLYSGHTGIFWAPTAEAGVPFDVAEADTAFTMCHEAAHRLGIASEQEANFCAYLACSESDDARLRYSGALSAFNYCVNALLRYDAERAQALVDEAAQGSHGEGVALVVADRAATRAHYDAYEGPFEDVGRAVNDGYLHSFGVVEGVRSYGLVVDYLIAWHLQDAY